MRGGGVTEFVPAFFTTDDEVMDNEVMDDEAMDDELIDNEIAPGAGLVARSRSRVANL